MCANEGFPSSANDPPLYPQHLGCETLPFSAKPCDPAHPVSQATATRAALKGKDGVSEGIRTPDFQNHNLAL
jgi:hypothetical protein